MCSQNFFPAEIDRIRSGYYHTRSALKLTNSHLRSQNFPREKPTDLRYMPQRYHSTPLRPTNVYYGPGVALTVSSDYSFSFGRLLYFRYIYYVTQSTVSGADPGGRETIPAAGLSYELVNYHSSFLVTENGHIWQLHQYCENGLQMENKSQEILRHL